MGPVGRLVRPGTRGVPTDAGAGAGSRRWRAGPGPWLAPLLLVALIVQPSPPAAAQEVRFTPRAESSAQRALARFLSEEEYGIWTRDTVLTRGDAVPGNLLVLEAAARIAGDVGGSIYVVDGDLFLRPGARIAGDVLVLGGGYYASSMATVEGEVTYRPNEVLSVLPEEGGYRILPLEEPRKAVDLGPLYGLRLPTYQRVDGWTFGWGGTARVTGLAWQPEVELSVRFKTEQEEVEGSVRQTWYPSARFRFGVEASRATWSNDAWIRPTAWNSVDFLFAGNDFRNYYRADRVGLRFELGDVDGWSFALVPRWEEARSLEARGQEIFFEPDVVRPNPPVDPGDTYSLTGAVEYGRRSGDRRTRFYFALEAASRDIAGDFSFAMGEFQGLLRRPLAFGHALEVFAVARGDLGGSLPRQRWSAIGGIGTLPTFETLSLRGERLAFADITYAVPIPPLQLPVFGPTEAFARGAFGTAWSEGKSLQVEQNAIFGFRILVLEVAVGVDPGSGDTVFHVNGRFPRELKGR